jgi:signal transduction histidine kinase
MKTFFRSPFFSRFRPWYISIAASALMGASVLLMWFGYRATEQWQQTTWQQVDQRTSEVMTLMIMALNRDMHGVQSEILPRLQSLDIPSRLSEIETEITTAFVRFPYTESFFIWRADGHKDGVLFVFNRSDRPPPWPNAKLQPARFPTAILKNPKEFTGLIRLVRDQASKLARFYVFETKVSGQRYQVIARLGYGGPSDTSLESVIGFTVNIDWVRQNYFSELTSQLSRIVNGQTKTVLTILDENGALVTTSAPPAKDRRPEQWPVREQRFPFLFFDPVLMAAAPDPALPVGYWTARAAAVEDERMLAAAGSARRTFMLISVSAIAAAIALILMIRAARTTALLAAMKSEFVSAVTHELKTPLASIRLAAETLAQGRFRSQDTVGEYATLLVNEVSHLTRTVNNLLSIARLQDVHGFYALSSLDLVPVVEEALGRFQTQLKEQGFEVHVDVPASLPPVYADRTAILHVLDNLLDNAIRYSNGRKRVDISASASEQEVSVRITDKGLGIPPDELPRVFDKFFRGRHVTSGGSGLGLAIVQRILHDHGGAIRLHSNPGGGTTAEVLLRLAEKDKDDETAHFGG